MRGTASPVRVLVVVAHAVLADALAGALERDDELEVVDTVASSDDALAAVASSRPDVVLVDHGLQEDRTLPLLAGLRQRSPGASVIVLTGPVDDRLALEAFEAGCSGVIARDRRLPDLVRAIKAAHAGDTQFSPEVLAMVLSRASRSSPLTAREREVLDLVAEGRTNPQIAELLTLSLHTVRNHVQSILRKLGAHSKLEAVAMASRRGLIAR